jgi:hypothetical protein
MGAPALAIRQGVLPEIPPDHTARLLCGSFAFRWPSATCLSPGRVRSVPQRLLYLMGRVATSPEAFGPTSAAPRSAFVILRAGAYARGEFFYLAAYFRCFCSGSEL